MVTTYHVAPNHHAIISPENAPVQFKQTPLMTAAFALQDGLELTVLWHSEEMAAFQTTSPAKDLEQHTTQPLTALATVLEPMENFT